MIERAQSSNKQYELNDNYQITFKPFKVKKSIGLSVITHTPTQKNSKHSVGLSAISHTPTEKYENQSVALSALHLSQQNREEDVSYKSIALSAVQGIESKESDVQPEVSDKKEIKQGQSSQSISNSSKAREVVQSSHYQSSNKLSTKKSSKQDYSCQVVHGRDREESHSSFRLERDVALDPYKRDQSVGAYKRNNATQFRISQKTESEEINNINKQLQVSDDLTIQLNFHKEKSVKITPNIDSSGLSKSSKVARMDKQVQVKNGRHVEIRTIQTKPNNRRNKDDDDDEEDKKDNLKGNGGRFNSNKREKDSKQRNGQSDDKTHPRYARKQAAQYQSKNREYDEEDTEFSGGEQSMYNHDYSDTESIKYPTAIEEKSRALNYSNSMRSEGIQADFSEEDCIGAQVDFEEEDNCKGVQVDFSEDNCIGVQADMDMETMGSIHSTNEGESLASSKRNFTERAFDSSKEVFDNGLDSEKEAMIEVSIGSVKDVAIEADFDSDKESFRELTNGSQKESLKEYSSESK